MGKNKNKGGYNGGYGSGYSSATVSAINNIALPDKIPCARCEKKKGHHCYSKNRLNDLRAHIQRTPRFNAASERYANCMMCSGAGAQQLEIDCIDCERTLPHGRFNKTQRRNPDNARCETCQAKRNEYEPGAGDSDDDSGNDGSSAGSDDLGDDLSATAGTMSTLSITGGTASGGGVQLNGSSMPGGYDSASNSRAASISDGNVRSTTTNATSQSQWKVTESHPSTLPAGVNPRGYGTPPNVRARNGDTSTRSDAGSSGGGKFAKVRASDAVRRPNGRPQNKGPAPPPDAHDDDDIGVASDSDDD